MTVLLQPENMLNFISFSFMKKQLGAYFLAYGIIQNTTISAHKNLNQTKWFTV